MKRKIYSKRRHLGEVEELGKCNGFSRRIWEGNQRRDDKKTIKKEKERTLNPEVEVFKKSELPEKYTAKILFGWNDRKFENKYLKKLERS